MTNVRRLPVVNPQKPSCSCGRSLPVFTDVNLALSQGDHTEFKTLALTLHVECACGKRWNLRKEYGAPPGT